ncbi:MAG: hypothetical protein ABIF19_21225 [Planctomycetota bacterium]
MAKGKAFFVVGHSNWGKSKTLRALTNGSGERYINIKKARFFIRRTSNDDEWKKFDKFLKELDPSRKPYVIVALCPKFDGRSRNIEEMLRQLKKKYKLFFFVLVHQWHEKGNRKISDGEIKKLERFREVKLYTANNNRDNADVTRAREFKRYIERKL